ncbi:MAG: OmpA family protein [Deltaproteobacteria bacterium]|nr:OmpA family protein [Deltaproteobacteria bacterium]
MTFARRLTSASSVLVVVVAVAGCRGQTSAEPPIVPFRGMHEMPRYDAQEHSGYFEDGRTMRPEIEGTVSREMEIDPQVGTGLDADGSYVLSVPTAVVERSGGLETLLRRGHQRYDIYCAPCHSEVGDGNGMVSQRAASLGVTFAAANLMDPAFQHMPDGRLFLTISNGVRTMPAYRAQIPVQDRWAIVAYVRALQVSRGDAAVAIADTDNDQLPAGADGCPEQPEDRDGFQDLDGCPEADNDADGIDDAADACPLSAGTAGLSGCAGTVAIDPADPLNIRLGANIRFENGRDVLKDESLAILDEIRAFLVAHPEVTRIAIEGHTDDRGDAAVNQALSERRARVVMQWLVQRGVSGERIQSAGFGSARPRGDNTTREGRQANRRVELHVVPPAVEADAAAPAGAAAAGGV